MTISELQTAIASRQKTVLEVVSEALDRATHDTKHSILSLASERALERARTIDQKLGSGEGAGKLAGIPFLAKDNILTFGTTTTAASHMLENFVAPYQATVIERLEAEGAICIGKTNLDAYAHGGSTENSYFGPTKNAVDDERVAGGSSGGSAAAVATGIVPFALGTDTGGSIRQPASFNGVVGFKPTYGSVSRYGAVAMASSTDIIGPIATTVEDAELVYDIIKGIDPKDGTTIEIETSSEPLKKVGVIKQYLEEGVEPEVKKRVQEAIETARQLGYEIVEIDMPILKYALAVYYIVVPAELTSNLARYDGIKYGLQKPGKDLSELYASSRSEGFMDENKRRILIGNYVLSSGYYDAYYHKAQAVRTKLIHAFDDAFKKVDVLVGPVTPTPAFKLGENTHDPLKMYLADIMTVPASLAGISAISVPLAVDSAALPIGLQVMAPMRQDKRLLEVAKIWEKQNG
jgi:aspartyl-tRNA(Asn)/glutamyl-tRNA(Gln) amidotransferase subunit A